QHKADDGCRGDQRCPSVRRTIRQRQRHIGGHDQARYPGLFRDQRPRWRFRRRLGRFGYALQKGPRGNDRGLLLALKRERPGWTNQPGLPCEISDEDQNASLSVPTTASLEKLSNE